MARFLLSTGPSRRLIASAGRTPTGFRILNRLSGLRRTYATFGEAAEACRRAGYVGHELPELRQIHLNWPRELSDYPVLLRLASVDGTKVFDFGGSVGNMYYSYAARLASLSRFEWTVYDLPPLVDAGLALARERGDTNLRFSSDLAAGRDCDIALFSGSLHYWEGTLAELFARMGSRPRHVIVNRSPMRDRGEHVVVVQTGLAAFPCRLLSRERLEAEFSALGYELVDWWREYTLSYQLTLLPEYSAQTYFGCYLRLAEPVAAPSEQRHRASLAS
ncbi:MAG: methyltransferase, TIGR04325 family [Vulcanimicrobiaceae bacterium]